MRQILVFGSNLQGVHNAGAALTARQYYGAIYGQGAGLQGNSYAIPTKDSRLKPLPLKQIEEFVRRFVVFVYSCNLKKKDYYFKITAIGCGLAGYTPEQIAPFFEKLLYIDNVCLPEQFLDIYKKNEANSKHYKPEEQRKLLRKNIELLFKKGFTQQEIADRLGIHQPTVNRYIKKIRDRYENSKN